MTDVPFSETSMTIYKRAGPILMKVRVACASLSLWYYLLLLIGATSLHIFFQDGSILQCIDVQHLKRDTEETNEICNCKNLPQVVREAWLSNDNDCRPIYNQLSFGYVTNNKVSYTTFFIISEVFLKQLLITSS